jgi:hypothetical protein
MVSVVTAANALLSHQSLAHSLPQSSCRIVGAIDVDLISKKIESDNFLVNQTASADAMIDSSQRAQFKTSVTNHLTSCEGNVIYVRCKNSIHAKRTAMASVAGTA